MNKHQPITFYVSLLVAFVIVFVFRTVTAEDIPVDDIRGPICVLKDTVSGTIFPLSPKRSQYNVIVTDGIAHVEVTQQYVNDYENINSIVYVFPLPYDGSVHTMEMEYRDSIYKAEIYEKKEAEQIYDSIQNEGGTAALLIQQKPNVFQQRLANIAYRDTAYVRIGLSMPLKYNYGEFELSIPTMVAARFGGSTGTDVPSSDPWNPPENRNGQGLQINVLIQTVYPIKNLNSPTHPLNIIEITDARPILEQRALLNQDSDLNNPCNICAILTTGGYISK